MQKNYAAFQGELCGKNCATGYAIFQVKEAHLDFSEAQHPNFERLMLSYYLSLVGQAAAYIY